MTVQRRPAGPGLRTTLAMAAMAAMLAIAPARADDASPIASWSALALYWANFDALDEKNARLRQSPYFAADGSSDVSEFRRGLERVIYQTGKHREAYLRELEVQTLQWATEHPRSAFAHVLHAKVLIAHGRSYRGWNWANDVPPEAMKQFHAYLRRAFDYLKAHAQVALTDSGAHALMLGIGKEEGWTPEQLETVADAGLKRNPRDIELYMLVVSALLPESRDGELDQQALDGFIRKAGAQTHRALGAGLYAVLYTNVATRKYGHRLFRDTLADWPTMKKGFEDLHARYPDTPALRNRFAYIACVAEDKTTLLALIDELGDELDASQWGANGARTMENCERLARKP